MKRPRTWEVSVSGALLLAVLALVLVASNLVLLRQNRALKQTLQGRAEPSFLQPGERLERLRGLDPDGREVTVEPDRSGRKTVLLVFHSKCGWCEKNIGNWRALIAESDPDRYRFVAVATRREGAAPYLRRHRLDDLPAIVDLDVAARLAYRLSGTPQTIVLDDDGRVEKIWIGALGEELEQQAEAYFGVDLPGVEPG